MTERASARLDDADPWIKVWIDTHSDLEHYKKTRDEPYFAAIP